MSHTRLGGGGGGGGQEEGKEMGLQRNINYTLTYVAIPKSDYSLMQTKPWPGIVTYVSFVMLFIMAKLPQSGGA